MASNLFGVEVPAVTDATDGSPYTLGTRFTVAVNGTATHGRWYFPASGQASVTVGVFRVSDQALLGSVAFVGPTPGAWNQQAYDPPIALVTTETYVAAVYTPARYVATANHDWPFVSGDLTADTSNGWFNDNGAQVGLTWPPTEPGNNSAYFADLVFVADGESSVAPDSLAVPVALGAPTVTPVSTAPDSLSIPVSLGAPFLHAIPDGISVPVALGAPTVQGPPPPTVRTGWSSYGAALRFNFDQAALEKDRPPLDCPNDGEALVALGDGTRRCPADGWQWPAKRIIERG